MPVRLRGVSLLVLLALPASGAGCGEPPPTQRRAVTTPSVREQRIVARVNGAPILLRDLELQMSGGQGRQAALRALIRQEVLAQEARRRGLDGDPQVLRAQERAMANLLVRRGFRARFTKEQVPMKLIEAAYKLNRPRYWHDELVRVDHIVARATERQSAAHHRKARQLAQKVRAIAASGQISAKEFKEIAALVDKDDAAVEVRAEGPFISPRPPARLAPDFLNAAFKLQKPGEISPVLQTQFGYHVIYLEARIPARHDPMERVQDEIRSKIFDQARQQAFVLWVEQLKQAHRAQVLQSAGAALAGSGR